MNIDFFGNNSLDKLLALIKSMKDSLTTAIGNKSKVTFTRNQTSGTKVGTINIDGTNYDIYAPSPTEQVQADWDVTDSYETSYIKNKPNLDDFITQDETIAYDVHDYEHPGFYTIDSDDSPCDDDGIGMYLPYGGSSTNYGHEFHVNDEDNEFYHRGKDGEDAWHDWVRVYDDDYHPNADYATTAGNATYASSAGYAGSANVATSATNATNATNADTVDNVHLEWSGSQAASSTDWIAGWTSDGTKLKAVKRSDLSVSYASTAGTAGNVTGTVAVANGGTGATTAANARSNLGLGGAATYGATSSVTSGSTSLITSGAVYSAVYSRSTAKLGVEAWLEKIGKLVIFHASYTASTDVIPSGYRPQQGLHATMWNIDQSAMARAYFNTNGTIELTTMSNSTLPAGKHHVYGVVCWFTS